MKTKLSTIGMIGKDAVQNIVGENPVINFPLARTEHYNVGSYSKTKTLWFECSLFTNDAELLSKLKKGMVIHVSGQPDLAFLTRKGKKVATLTLKVNYFKLITQKPTYES